MLELFKALVKTGGGALANLLLGVATTKIFALLLGPTGLGLFSVLRQARDTLVAAATFNSGTAMVQGLAVRPEGERKDFSLVVLVIMAGFTLALALATLALAPWIAPALLHQSGADVVAAVRWLGVVLLAASAQFYLGGILNGYRAIGRLALTQALVSLAALALAYPAALWVRGGHAEGFSILMALSYAVGTLAAYIFAARQGWLPGLNRARALISGGAFAAIARSYLGFASVTLLTGLAFTGSVLLIRSLIVRLQGLEVAGIFDASWTLSMMYMTLSLNSLGTYYLPSLARLTGGESRAGLVAQVMRFTLTIIVPAITGVIVLKPLLVQVLYSAEFLPALTNIRWMLLGDYLKATAWVFGMTILAAADTRTLFKTEMAWQAVFFALSMVSLFALHALEGIGTAYALTYALYLGVMFFYVRRRVGFRLTRGLALRWAAGLLILAGASAATWNAREVSWLAAAGWLALAGGYALLSAGPDNLRKAASLLRAKITPRAE